MREPRLEKTLEARFVREMLAEGYLNHKADRGAETNVGENDQVFYGYKRRTIIVEFKRLNAKKNRHQKLQDLRREQFRERGYEVYRVQGREECEALFLKIAGRRLYESRTKKVR